MVKYTQFRDKLDLMEEEKLNQIYQFQKNEITEYHVYNALSTKAKDAVNKKVLKDIADDEMRHYLFWKNISKRDILPDKTKVTYYIFLSKIFGLSFAVKLMEMGEENAQEAYADFSKVVPKVKELITDEDRHEMETLRLIHDQFLKYAGSIVLGLNDALVELTGALAGLTFALQNAKLISVSGLITGVAAAFSMAASEYLSLKAEEKTLREAIHSSIYTGIVYMIVVLSLVSPYLIFSNVYLSLGITLSIGIFIIILFSIYVSVAQQISFKRQFLEMTSLSLGIAAITFLIGLFLRHYLGIQV